MKDLRSLLLLLILTAVPSCAYFPGRHSAAVTKSPTSVAALRAKDPNFWKTIAIHTPDGELNLPDGPDELPDDYTTRSPDGRYVASFQTRNPDTTLKIKDTRTGATTLVGAEWSPVFILQWTPDSQALITMGHIAHGCMVSVFRQNKSGWVGHDVEPPYYGRGIEPLEFIPDGDVIHFKFETSFSETDRRSDEKEYFSTFDYHIPTGRMTRVRTREMTDPDEYVRNRWRYDG